MMIGADMKRFSPILLALAAACGTGSRVEEVPPELRVYRPSVPPLAGRHGSSRLNLVAPGTWVRYRISGGGESIVTLGAVRAEPAALWVEAVEEGDPKKASLRRITFDGTVTSARFREFPASGPPSEIADQPVSNGSDEVPFRVPPAEETSATRDLAVGEKTVAATVFKRLFRDDSVGREFEENEAWSHDVPPLLEALELSGKTAGLVYRKSRSGSVELVDWGTGYSPLIR